MFEFTETIEIAAAPETVWSVMQDVESWWSPSNPEHLSLERLDNRGAIEVGTRLKIREKIAGIPGEAAGEITRVDPVSAVTWQAPEAHYRIFGIGLTVDEGVTWGIEPTGSGTRVSAHVWATFPAGRLGHIVEWGFTRLLGGVEKDREHARTELRYLKRTIEAETGSASSPASRPPSSPHEFSM